MEVFNESGGGADGVDAVTEKVPKVPPPDRVWRRQATKVDNLKNKGGGGG